MEGIGGYLIEKMGTLFVHLWSKPLKLLHFIKYEVRLLSEFPGEVSTKFSAQLKVMKRSILGFWNQFLKLEREAFLVPLLWVLVASFLRLLPHPPNMTPIMAIALFGGRYFASTKQAFLVPLCILLLTDWIIGFHQLTVIVYVSILISTFIGLFLRRKPGLLNTTWGVFFASLQFYIVTNFAVWLVFYPQTTSGFITCYINAIPYFKNSLIGNYFYTGLLFGTFYLVRKHFFYLEKREISI